VTGGGVDDDPPPPPPHDARATLKSIAKSSLIVFNFFSEFEF
jgi:hypothetical protein